MVSVLDMDSDLASKFMADLPRLSRMVRRATGSDGVNVIHNAGKAAGQEVLHAHVHVLPRFDGTSAKFDVVPRRS